MVSLFAAVFLGIIFGVTLLIFTGIYNSLQSVRKQVERNWETLDHYLKNRDAEIPRLLQLILQKAPQEKVLIEKVKKHKEHGLKITTLSQKIKHSNEMTNLLSSLLLICDAYLELKTNLEYKKLKTILMQIEKELINRQEHFNTTVKVFNHKCEQFPDLIFAQTMGFSSLELLSVYEENADDQSWYLKMAA